jgi:hypothetical protein
MYNVIKNPLTNRNVSVNSKLGKTIINNYLKGGAQDEYGASKWLDSEETIYTDDTFTVISKEHSINILAEYPIEYKMRKLNSIGIQRTNDGCIPEIKNIKNNRSNNLIIDFKNCETRNINEISFINVHRTPGHMYPQFRVFTNHDDQLHHDIEPAYTKMDSSSIEKNWYKNGTRIFTKTFGDNHEDTFSTDVDGVEYEGELDFDEDGHVIE